MCVGSAGQAVLHHPERCRKVELHSTVKANFEAAFLHFLVIANEISAVYFFPQSLPSSKLYQTFEWTDVKLLCGPPLASRMAEKKGHTLFISVLFQ